MIRINLLPVKRKKKPKPIPGFLAVAVILIIITSIGVVYAYFNIKEEIKTLQVKKVSNEQRLKELKKKLKELENYESLVKSVEQKKKVIIQLRKNQSIPVRLLDEISKHLPNGIWLSVLRVKDKSVNIEGYAFTNSDVVKYVNNLKGSALFNSVYLAESKHGEISEEGLKEKVPVYKFKIRLKIKG